jgi:hypothetical protein
MDNIYPGSVPVYNNTLHLAYLPKTDIGILTSDYHPFYPQTGFKEGHSVSFTINSSATQYLDLKESYIYLRIKIVKSDGTELDSSVNVTGVEAFYASLFESCQLLLNGTPLTRNSPSLYSYKYFLETLLGYGIRASDSYLKNEMWYPEEVDSYEAVSTKVYKNRQALTKGKKELELIGRVSEGICFQSKLIPNNIEVSLTLRRSKPQFSLCSPEEASKTPFPYKIVLEEAIWMIKRHSIHPQVLAKHQNLLNTRRFDRLVSIRKHHFLYHLALYL